MEAKAAAEREESRKREIAATQLGELRVSEAARTSQKEVTQLQQTHAALLQLEQQKAAALVAAANESAREIDAAATKREQEMQEAAKAREKELQEARDKALQDAFEDKNKRIDKAVLYYVIVQVHHVDRLFRRKSERTGPSTTRLRRTNRLRRSLQHSCKTSFKLSPARWDYAPISVGAHNEATLASS